MKRRLYIVAVILLAGVFSVQAQEEKMSKKEKRKQTREAELKYKYIITGQLLDSMKFVLEADFLDDNRGNRIVVPQNLNFIKIDSTEAVLQIGQNTGIGSNGVGGTTAEGRVTQFNVNKNEKKKTYDVHMILSTNLGNYDIFMLISADGSARATLSGTYPGKLVWDGDIVSLKQSRVFKGTTSY